MSTAAGELGPPGAGAAAVAPAAREGAGTAFTGFLRFPRPLFSPVLSRFVRPVEARKRRGMVEDMALWKGCAAAFLRKRLYCRQGTMGKET